MRRFMSATLAVLAATIVVPAPSASAASGCQAAAHRGAHGPGATENGMGAFWAAARAGAEILEGDVHASSDDGLVLMHDATLGRTTTGRGYVADYRARRIHQVLLDDGRAVPYLWQLLELARDKDRVALVELKAMGTWTSYVRLARLVRRYGSEHVVIQSWSMLRLHRIRRLVDVRTALVTATPVPIGTARAAGGLVLEERAATDGYLKSLAGMPVYVWPVDAPDGWRRLAGRVTAVITNDAVGFIAARATFPSC